MAIFYIWHRKLKFAFDVHSLASKITSKNPIRESITRANQYDSLVPTSKKSRVPVFSLSSPVPGNLGFQFGPKQNQYSPFLGVAKRYYYVDRRQVQHFREKILQWFLFETVPYTKRTRFLPVSRDVERYVGEKLFEKEKEPFKRKILPATHPESVRVQLIANDIILVAQRGLKKEQVWRDPGYASESAGTHETSGPETLLASSDTAEVQWHKEDEILDDKWVQQNRKRGQEKRSQSASKHLERFNWEVLLVNDPGICAWGHPGGKIVLSTGTLEHFGSDAEIATLIGHEVGHLIARHPAEIIAKHYYIHIPLRILHILKHFSTPYIVEKMKSLIDRIFHSGSIRNELEADYIGMLLMASAGYDPRFAPKVYEQFDELDKKFEQLVGDSTLKDCPSTHPSGQERAKLLAQVKVMEEALALYREARPGREGEEARHVHAS